MYWSYTAPVSPPLFLASSVAWKKSISIWMRAISAVCVSAPVPESVSVSVSVSDVRRCEELSLSDCQLAHELPHVVELLPPGGLRAPGQEQPPDDRDDAQRGDRGSDRPLAGPSSRPESSILLTIHARVKGIAQTFSEEIVTENGQQNSHAGED